MAIAPRSRRTKKVVWFQVDIGGLDGWYWRYETAELTLPEPMPVGWLAMNGAMRLVKPVEVTTFLVHPGPGVAFVIPNLMKARNVRAVVGEVPVDRHTGWAITYLRRGVERRPDAERLGSQFYQACPADHVAWPGAPTPSGTRPPPRVSLPDADWSVAEPVTGRDCDETAVVVTRLWLDERCGAGIA